MRPIGPLVSAYASDVVTFTDLHPLFSAIVCIGFFAVVWCVTAITVAAINRRTP